MAGSGTDGRRVRATSLALGVATSLVLLAGCWGLPSLPLPVTGVQASVTATSISLSWTNPPASFWGVRVFRAEGSTPPSGPDDGALVADVGNGESFTDSGRSPSTTYSYALIVYGADGYNSTPAAITVSTSATPVAAVSAGNNHTCALGTTGTVRCWGFNDHGQLGNGTTTSSATPVSATGITTASAITAGGSHTCALAADGTIRCWGHNGFGQLGNGTTTSSTTPVTVTGITTAVACHGSWQPGW